MAPVPTADDRYATIGQRTEREPHNRQASGSIRSGVTSTSAEKMVEGSLAPPSRDPRNFKVSSSPSSTNLTRHGQLQNHREGRTSHNFNAELLPLSLNGSYRNEKRKNDGPTMTTEHELAVAIEIYDDDDDNDKAIAYGIDSEYDPDSRPPFYKNRRFRVYALGLFLGCTVLATLLIVIIVFSGEEEKGIDKTSAPSQSPTSSLEDAYLQYFADVLKNERVLEPGTPHYSAARWIMNEDPMKLSPHAPNLFQRFMMAFLWFHTTDNGKTEWRSCNPPREGESNKSVFEDLKISKDDSFYYDFSEDTDRWLSGEDECSWAGIECAGTPHVLGFRLLGHNLTGTLPTELTELPFLQLIFVAYNQLTGTIPAAYGDMRYLMSLQVQYNLLTSTIPEEIYTGSNVLQELNIGGNLMTGTLDTRVGTLRELKGLYIFENGFEGEFPTEIGNLDLLAYMRVDANDFSGLVPSELGALTQLVELWLMENEFTSTIPTELGQLSRLTDLRLSTNQITGTIPEELFDLNALKFLQLEQNKLTGTLSTSVVQLSKLLSLRVNDNALTAVIPSELQYVSTIGQIWIMYNQFTGEVPLGICNLYVTSQAPQGLESLSADCDGNPPPNVCTCCSTCCDRVDKICY